MKPSSVQTMKRSDLIALLKTSSEALAAIAPEQAAQLARATEDAEMAEWTAPTEDEIAVGVKAAQARVPVVPVQHPPSDSTVEKLKTAVDALEQRLAAADALAAAEAARVAQVQAQTQWDARIEKALGPRMARIPDERRAAVKAAYLAAQQVDVTADDAALEADVAGFEAAQGWLFAGGKRERPGRLQGATTVQKGEQTGDSEQALVDLMVGAAIGPGPVRA